MAKTPLKKPYLDIREYGAVPEGAGGLTDNTTAIQAALDDAGNATSAGPSRTVYVPNGTWGFTTVKMPAATCLRGEGPALSTLMRMTGSSGTALRNKNFVEGGGGGATSVYLSDLCVHGNNDGAARTTGDGVAFGRTGDAATALNMVAQVYRVWSRFHAGWGFDIYSNASYAADHLWASWCTNGIRVDGGASQWQALWAEYSTTTQVEVAGYNQIVVGVNVEGLPSAKPLLISGNDNLVIGTMLGTAGGSMSGGAIRITGARAHILDAYFDSHGQPMDHHIYNVSSGTGTGTDAFRIAEYYDRAAVQKDLNGFYDATTGGNVTVNPQNGYNQYIAAVNATGFTITSTTGWQQRGWRLVLHIGNISGTTMGTITWDPLYKLAGAWTNPINGKSRLVEFVWNGSNWYEMSRSAADV